MLHFSSPSLRQLKLRRVSLWDWRSYVCVYTNLCGNRETDSVQFTGPESGRVRKCWSGNTISYARTGKGSGNKTERGILKEGGRGSSRKPEKWEIKRDQEKQGKAPEVDPAKALCSRHTLSNIREKYYAGDDNDLHGRTSHVFPPPPSPPPTG